MVTKSLFVTVTAVIFHSSYALQEKRLLNTTHVSQAEDSGKKLEAMKVIMIIVGIF